MRNQRGITLIALIVTIIVLIIIAGISIATLTSDNGILRQVDSAKVAQIEGTAREEVNLAMGALRIAIAEAQSRDNAYKAYANAKTIQTSMVSMLNSDTQLVNKSGWTGTDATEAATTSPQTFTVEYTGADYQNACNDTNAKIVYTIKLTQSSIECVDIATSTIAPSGTTNAIKPEDIGGKNLVNGLRPE